MLPCGYDCFTCPYADCIFDDDPELFAETELEIAESEERDRRAERERCEADCETEAQAQRQQWLAIKRKSHQARREHEKTQKAAHRAEIRTEINARNTEYWKKNAHGINARRNERRHRKRALKQAEKHHNANQKGGNKSNGKTGQ